MAAKIRVKRSVQTKSFTLRHQDVKKQWVVIDAEGVILGRLAATIATLLRGKHRPTFTPSVDSGDNVIVINADKVKMTGNKATDKKFYYHTGYPGGIKERTRAQILAGAHPERVIEKAVERMMPRGPLGRRQMGNLKVYAGAEHPHTAQNPTAIDFAARNPKNKRVK
ncbi:MAG: 50S ribosomal protein L13 [Alphaproteobacteria bacterium]|nr:50S ribosomal protein L13 [Alphaproteobacteria bacterium]MBV8549094.1 50S ribosomal protein L13 [Alphaproteobacteria bacterium]